MSEATPPVASRSGDREYLWFAMILMAVLTTSVAHSPEVANPPTTAAVQAP